MTPLAPTDQEALDRLRRTRQEAVDLIAQIDLQITVRLANLQAQRYEDAIKIEKAAALERKRRRDEVRFTMAMNRKKRWRDCTTTIEALRTAASSCLGAAPPFLLSEADWAQPSELELIGIAGDV